MLLHGFTQTGACLGPLSDDLARDHTVRLPDLPGHGGSAMLARADLWHTADLVAEACGTGIYVGYSMGGRAALHLALAHPELVDGLVLIGATAGIEDSVDRAARVAADEALADRVTDIGVDRFLQEWLAQPLFADLPDWARFDDERRANTAAGLAASLRHAGTGAMEPLWDRLGSIDVPVLCLAGEHDTKFTALAERLAASIGPNATVGIVAGAGHAVHLEAPDATIALVRNWLSRDL